MFLGWTGPPGGASRGLASEPVKALTIFANSDGRGF
jgi:hypothetical protein